MIWIGSSNQLSQLQFISSRGWNATQVGQILSGTWKCASEEACSAIKLTAITTGSPSSRWSSKLTKLVWICSKKGPSEGPLPNRDRLPNKVNAAARTAGVGWWEGRSESEGRSALWGRSIPPEGHYSVVHGGNSLSNCHQNDLPMLFQQSVP